MATYTQGCSQVGSFSYAGNFTLYVELNDRDGNSSTNRSQVDYNVYCQSSGSGSIRANHDLYFELNGQVIRNENVYVNVSSPNAYIGIASGTLEVEHNSDGSKGIWFSASINATGGYGVSASKGDTFWLNQIPRYTTVWNSERGKTINSISVNWSTSDSRDWTQYSLNDGAWQDAYDTVAWDNKSGYYTIPNLQPNTTYKVRTRCRRADSGLWSEAGNIWITTYDIARITNAPNIEHGNKLTVNYSNPSGASIEIGIWKTDGWTSLTGGYRSCSGSSYTFSFTDQELDTFYKLYGNSKSITLRVYIKTNSNYLNYKEFKITLKRKSENSTHKI